MVRAKHNLKLLRLAELASVAALAGMGETALWLSMITEALTLAQAAALHVTIVAALGWWTFFVRHRRAVRMATLLAITTTAMGPFGPLGTLLALAINARFETEEHDLDEWYKSLFPEEQAEQANQVYDAIVSGRDLSGIGGGVASFTDVLRAGTIEQKRAVVTLLARNFRPAFAPALRLALADPIPAIRVQAATAASEIESDFLERALELTHKADRHPQDFAPQWALAQLFDDYAFTGLLDPDRETENRDKALQLYMHCCQLKPGHAAAAAAFGRMLLRQGDVAGAADWLDGCLASGTSSPQMLFWHMECLYRLGRYGALRTLIQERYYDTEVAESQADSLRSILRLWGRPRATAAACLAETATP